MLHLLFLVEVFVMPIGEEIGDLGCAWAKVPGRSSGESVHRVTVCQLRLAAEVCRRSLRRSLLLAYFDSKLM